MRGVIKSDLDIQKLSHFELIIPNEYFSMVLSQNKFTVFPLIQY